ncbi:uncharacterized protein YeaO (DUF488 family) [Murinocardiopsis flavida]|uniref:Uncharacterized protein YeaO (DUF488 family) n=1 Tax=Murinocardiopsis flavida TaxID=645275 RepID=A0A2P8DLT2_9ACTN|nr:DUF488 domain-containing protein [Murinocardiopsis flavida]PSK98176.1 uncharacterized protein YeaO (DUF488 family) [Murinocardiopsis flavida]
MGIDVKRVYDDPEKSDGHRVLVDRLWPRGLSKEKAAVDEWLRDVAPSDPLRTWFGHRPERFAEFARRYRAELDGNGGAKELRDLARDHDHITLLYAARDTEHNQAIVLRDYLA